MSERKLMYKKVTLLCLSAFLLGCNPISSEKIDNSEICVYSNDDEAKACKNGKLAYFKPNQWGNEQLPLSVIAGYCDYNYQIIHNHSGVVCVFDNHRMNQAPQKK